MIRWPVLQTAVPDFLFIFLQAGRGIKARHPTSGIWFDILQVPVASCQSHLPELERSNQLTCFLGVSELSFDDWTDFHTACKVEQPLCESEIAYKC